jgi:hypothetical protein
VSKRTLNIYSSNGACPNKSAYRDFTPCNTAYVFGDPGESVIVSVGSGGSFVGYSSNTREITIGQSGYESLDVSSVNSGLLTIQAYNPLNSNRNANVNMVFLEPKPGGDYIDLYSGTTGAPSDGVSTAKVYLYISSLLNSIETNYVQVAVTNNSNIVNCNDQSTGEIPIPPSGQVEVAITSIYPGTKKVYFHVKNLPLTTPLSVDIDFIDIGVL